MIKRIVILVVFLITLLIGFQLFVSGPRGEVGDLQKSVQNLRSGVEVSPDTVTLSLPPRNRVVAAAEESARASGMSVKEINFLEGRVEIVSESDPTTVAAFAREISTAKDLQAVAIDGTLLPQSVVTVEPKN